MIVHWRWCPRGGKTSGGAISSQARFPWIQTQGSWPCWLHILSQGACEDEHNHFEYSTLVQWGDTSIYELDMWACVSKDHEMTRILLETMSLFSIVLRIKLILISFRVYLAYKGSSTWSPSHPSLRLQVSPMLEEKCHCVTNKQDCISSTWTAE